MTGLNKSVILSQRTRSEFKLLFHWNRFYAISLSHHKFRMRPVVESTLSLRTMRGRIGWSNRPVSQMHAHLRKRQLVTSPYTGIAFSRVVHLHFVTFGKTAFALSEITFQCSAIYILFVFGLTSWKLSRVHCHNPLKTFIEIRLQLIKYSNMIALISSGCKRHILSCLCRLPRKRESRRMLTSLFMNSSLLRNYAGSARLTSGIYILCNNTCITGVALNAEPIT